MTILSVEILKETVCALNAIIQPLICNVCILFSTQKHETINDSTIMFKYGMK